MRFLLCCLLLLPCEGSLLAAKSGLGPNLPTADVTVLLGFDKPYSDASLTAMRQELNSLLSGSGLQVTVALRTEFSKRQVGGQLVVFSMKGACSMDSLPLDAVIDERGPLAITYSSDGQLLPFGAVNCDHVRVSLQRVFGRGARRDHDGEYGIALARVMAHEIYHMMANSSAHTRTGITKESLSAHELLAARFGLSEQAQDAVRVGVVHDTTH